MEKLYRKNYTGEFFIHRRTFTDGTVQEEREWIPNTIPLFDHTGNAVIIGNGLTRKSLELSLIGNHRGGHLVVGNLLVMAAMPCIAISHQIS